jgi:hypothetical protein
MWSGRQRPCVAAPAGAEWVHLFQCYRDIVCEASSRHEQFGPACRTGTEPEFVCRGRLARGAAAVERDHHRSRLHRGARTRAAARRGTPRREIRAGSKDVDILEETEALRLKTAQAKVLAEDQARLANRRLYFAHLNLAQHALDAGRIEAARELLDRHAGSSSEDDIRGFEWHYLNRRAASVEPVELKGHTESVLRLAISPDGQRLASASADGTVKVWDPATGRELLALTGHTGPVLCVTFSPDGERIATSGEDRTVRLWDAETGSAARSFDGHADAVVGVVFNQNGTQLASASADETVKLRDLTSGDELSSLSGYDAWVKNISFVADWKWLPTVSWDATIKKWMKRARQASTAGKRHRFLLTNVAFSPDGRRVASASGDAAVRLWDVSSDSQGWPIGQLWRTLESASDVVNCMTFSPDGQRMATASDDHFVRLWDIETGEIVLTLRGHAAPVWHLAFSPDGRRIASASADGAVMIWDASPVHP